MMRINKSLLLFVTCSCLLDTLVGMKVECKVTPLMQAADAGEFDKVNELLDKEHVDVNEKGPAGTTALLSAVFGQYGHGRSGVYDAIVARLIQAGSDVNAKLEGNGRSSLIVAAYSGFNKAIRRLLYAGAKIDAQMQDGMTALMHAVISDRGDQDKMETVAVLLDGGARTDIKDQQGRTALDLAGALKEDNLIVKNAVLKMLRVADNQGITPKEKTTWFWAVETGDIDTVESMLQKNPNLAKIKSFNGSTALMKVIKEANNGSWEGFDKKGAEVLDELIKYSDINAQDIIGVTALMYAAYGSSLWANKRVIQALFAAHPDLDKQDADGSTALIMATRQEHADTVTTLLDAGANKNLKDNDGKTALDYAREGKNGEIIKLLEAAPEQKIAEKKQRPPAPKRPAPKLPKKKCAKK
ncbi:MAG: ankyrin repeat domain-containing protein [Candidatus Babeliales bacterium]|jgi:ankyrin repeat protein